MIEYRVITQGTFTGRVGRCTRYAGEGVREVNLPAESSRELNGRAVTLSVHHTRIATPDEAKACRAAFKAAKEAFYTTRNNMVPVSRERAPNEWASNRRRRY